MINTYDFDDFLKVTEFLGQTLTMVAWLTMVNHGWTMVDNG